MMEMVVHATDATGHVPSLTDGIQQRRQAPLFPFVKRAFDVVMSVALLPIMLTCALSLFLLNPIANRGPLLFPQIRMGKDCKLFIAYKFRSMNIARQLERAANDPLEYDRITPLGRLIRKSRIDELPQIINVLRGEMSLIGPRPDYAHHARKYLRTIPGYRERHAIRPGISGYAQTRLGYIEGIDATRQKVAFDLEYIENQSFALDARVLLDTLRVVVTSRGL